MEWRKTDGAKGRRMEHKKTDGANGEGCNGERRTEQREKAAMDKDGQNKGRRK